MSPKAGLTQTPDRAKKCPWLVHARWSATILVSLSSQPYRRRPAETVKWREAEAQVAQTVI